MVINVEAPIGRPKNLYKTLGSSGTPSPTKNRIKTTVLSYGRRFGSRNFQEISFGTGNPSPTMLNYTQLQIAIYLSITILKSSSAYAFITFLKKSIS